MDYERRNGRVPSGTSQYKRIAVEDEQFAKSWDPAFLDYTGTLFAIGKVVRTHSE